MGLAASQFNTILLLGRKADIALEEQQLSNRREALTREMNRVTRAYRNSYSAKKLQWSANSGVSYSALSYSTLMQPGGTNNNSPLIVTNFDGNVILSEKYRPYAEMIKNNGGKYEGDTRYKILEGLIPGVSAETFKKYDETSSDVSAKKKIAEDALTYRDTKIPYKNYSVEELISKLLTASAIDYSKTQKIDESNIDKISSGVQKALCGKNYFTSTVEDAIKNACNATADDYKSHKDNEEYKDYKVEDFISTVFAEIARVSGGSDTIRVMINSSTNAGTQAEYDAADAAYKTALADYQTAVGVNAEVIDGPTKKQIEFYDQLFQAVAEMGWELDSQITDSDYFNQVLQNNTYYLTTMTKNTSYDSSQPVDNRNYMYSYDTELAENNPNIFKVNDSSVQELALAEYEYEKSIINNKEKVIDEKMKRLETEMSAIIKMIESVEKVKNDNIERTMNLWS